MAKAKKSSDQPQTKQRGSRLDTAKRVVSKLSVEDKIALAMFLKQEINAAAEQLRKQAAQIEMWESNKPETIAENEQFPGD